MMHEGQLALASLQQGRGGTPPPPLLPLPPASPTWPGQPLPPPGHPNAHPASPPDHAKPPGHRKPNAPLASQPCSSEPRLPDAPPSAPPARSTIQTPGETARRVSEAPQPRWPLLATAQRSKGVRTVRKLRYTACTAALQNRPICRPGAVRREPGAPANPGKGRRENQSVT